MTKENLISDWNETVGLTISLVESFLFTVYDDPVELTIIYFTNGKFLVQEDQSSYTTTCGLLSFDDLEKWLIKHESFKLKI